MFERGEPCQQRARCSKQEPVCLREDVPQAQALKAGLRRQSAQRCQRCFEALEQLVGEVEGLHVGKGPQQLDQRLVAP